MSPVNLSNIVSFLSKFSILENDYNLFNTFFYSFIGILVYFFIVYPYLLFRKFKLDNYFLFSVVLFILIGSIIRMFSFNFFNVFFQVSKNPLNIGFYLYYPNLFIFLSVLYFFVFELSHLISKKTNFKHQKVIFYFSIALLLPLLFILIINFLNWFLFLKVLFFSFLIFFIFFYTFKKIKIISLECIYSKFAFFSQILDSLTTFFAINFYKGVFYEKHLLSSLILSINPIFFIIFKVLFGLFLLFLIDKLVKDNNLNKYFKLFIIIIGFSTALKNLFILGLAII